MTHTVNDRRGQVQPKPTCRVCGCETEHTSEYNKPTMLCIGYLREQIKERDEKLESMYSELIGRSALV